MAENKKRKLAQINEKSCNSATRNANTTEKTSQSNGYYHVSVRWPWEDRLEADTRKLYHEFGDARQKAFEISGAILDALDKAHSATHEISLRTKHVAPDQWAIEIFSGADGHVSLPRGTIKVTKLQVVR